MLILVAFFQSYLYYLVFTIRCWNSQTEQYYLYSVFGFSQYQIVFSIRYSDFLNTEYYSVFGIRIFSIPNSIWYLVVSDFGKPNNIWYSYSVKRRYSSHSDFKGSSYANIKFLNTSNMNTNPTTTTMPSRAATNTAITKKTITAVVACCPYWGRYLGFQKGDQIGVEFNFQSIGKHFRCSGRTQPFQYCSFAR